MQQWTAIQELARQGLNISDIQRETGFAWNTVKKYLDEPPTGVHDMSGVLRELEPPLLPHRREPPTNLPRASTLAAATARSRSALGV